MKRHDEERFVTANTQIQEILVQYLKQIVTKLNDYYDQAVIGEHEFLRSLNDKLAELRLPPNEQLDVESFEANISLKKETLRTKLEKRGVTKIQKLLNSDTVQPESGVDTRHSNGRRRRNRRRKKEEKE